MDRKANLEVPLSEAAHQLKLSWAAAWKLVLIGDLEGRREGRRWLVQQRSIDRYGDSAQGTRSPPAQT